MIDRDGLPWGRADIVERRPVPPLSRRNLGGYSRPRPEPETELLPPRRGCSPLGFPRASPTSGGSLAWGLGEGAPMRNKIDDLRNHLFETLEALKDDEKPMDLDRARAVAEVAKVIVESAKVEVAFLKVTGAVRATGFIPEGDDETVPVGRRLPAQKAS
jgi:hypothetical protein